ncbi:MAG: dUTP diphosphatase [Lachnospiraceae bacterium]|nr:dUTP diphosphatase [Lachnospiraceae bacterium]MCD8326514.1 dUTP diphosphatase [Lachnospiraceae bacterium]
MKVVVNKLKKNAIIPTLNKVDSYDIYACMDTHFVTIEPGKSELISTGLQLIIPEGYVGLVISRNGLAARRGLRIASGSMIVESDVELVIPIHNDSYDYMTVENGFKIAKLVLIKNSEIEFEVNE